MKIRTIKEIEGTERDVTFTGGNSLRLILASDNMGFGFCKTMIPKCGPHHWHYPYHLEACFCITGKGSITNLDTGEIFAIVPDTIYMLDKHDNHTFEAFEDTVLISVFNPPLTGQEKHDANGEYKLPPESELTLEEISQTSKHKAWEIVKAVNSIDNDYDAAEFVEQILTNQI
jgi:L-ectoine synthase